MAAEQSGAFVLRLTTGLSGSNVSNERAQQRAQAAHLDRT